MHAPASLCAVREIEYENVHVSVSVNVSVSVYVSVKCECECERECVCSYECEGFCGCTCVCFRLVWGVMTGVCAPILVVMCATRVLSACCEQGMVHFVSFDTETDFPGAPEVWFVGGGHLFRCIRWGWGYVCACVCARPPRAMGPCVLLPPLLTLLQGNVSEHGLPSGGFAPPGALVAWLEADLAAAAANRANRPWIVV